VKNTLEDVMIKLVSTITVCAFLAACTVSTEKPIADYTNAPCSVIGDRYERTTSTIRYHATNSWENLQKAAPLFSTSGNDFSVKASHQITREAIQERAAVLPHIIRCKTPIMELQEETLKVVRPLPYWIEQR
jgi:hypothetical protein